MSSLEAFITNLVDSMKNSQSLCLQMIQNDCSNWDGPNFSLEEFFFPRGIFLFLEEFFWDYLNPKIYLAEFFPRGNFSASFL